MIRDKKVLAIIPARGGSKGVPHKNIRSAAGKPLIAWTIEEADKSRYIDRLIVSSDDTEIIQVAKEWGCEAPFIRPPELANDDTPGVAPVLHAISELPGYDYVVLLQPTSPLRTAKDIDRCIETCLDCAAPACVSVTIAADNPYWMYTVGDGVTLRPLLQSSQFTRRQDLPKVYVLNGAVYVANVSWLLKEQSFLCNSTVAYIMPQERSLDIDDESDLKYFEILKLNRV